MKHTLRSLCGVLLLGSLALAQGDDADLFPLQVGTIWTYQLTITRGAEKESFIYTARVRGTQELNGVECSVVEQKSDERLFQTAWYYVDEDGVIRNPRRQNSARIHDLREGASDKARILLDPRVLAGDGADASWPWRSADGSAKGTISVEERNAKLRLPKPLRAELECVVLLERGEFKAGGRTATQERRMWLAPGLGLVKETSEIKIDGDIATQSEAYLIQYPRHE